MAASKFALVIGTGLLVPVLPLILYLKCVQHFSASNFALAAVLPSEIHLALFLAGLYTHSVVIDPLRSRVT